MELFRGDQTTRRGVRLACGVIALAALALAACNNETQTGPGGANTLVFVGNVNGANASLAGSIVMTIDETRAVATFKVVAPGSEGGTTTGEDGFATIGDGGTATIGDEGTGTGDEGGATGTQSSTTLQDNTKTWTVNQWAGRPVTIRSGAGAGQTRIVSSNTATILTVSPAWDVTPVSGSSRYAITQTSTTLQDVTKTWTTDEWAGRPVRINAGTGAGQTRTVSTNDVNTLTVSVAWDVTPDGTSEYVITQTSTLLEDVTKTWTTDEWAGRPVRINAGTGAGQTRTVSTNNVNTLTVSSAWDPTPDGTSEYVITQTNTLLEDLTKTWPVNQWTGRTVSIKAGTGAGQSKTVSSNTANTLTVSSAWATTPDASSEYAIAQTSTTLQDTLKTWTTDQWLGRKVSIKAGTGAGQTRTVSTNTGNTLTVSTAWTTKPDASSQYVIGVGATATVGLTGTYNTSSRAVSASGSGYTFDGSYDGSSRLVGTFTGPSSSSGTFLTERATSNPMVYCGPFTSQTLPLGDNGIFNVTLSGSTVYGTATAVGGAVFALDGTIVPGDNGTGSGDAGTADGAQTSTTLQDVTKVWVVNQWAGRPVRIKAGLGAGQTRTVSSNTDNTLTVSPAWSVTPGSTSDYVIMQTSTTLEDLDKTWTVNEWAGRTVSINAGSGAGQTRTVSSNTANTLTVPAWDRLPDGTSQYVISIGITIPSLATGQANSTVSRLAGSFTFGTNAGIWDGARCDQ